MSALSKLPLIGIPVILPIRASEAGVKRISIGAVLDRLAYGSLVNAAREMLTSGTFDFSLDAMDYDELESMFSGAPGDT